MAIWKRPRAARAGESKRAEHFTYVVRWRYGGKRDGAWQTVTVGNTRAAGRIAEETDERAASLGYKVTAADVRGWLAGDDDEPEQPPTVGELVDAWVNRANRTEGTRRAYRTVAKRLGDLADVCADRLTAAQVNGWLTGIERRGLSQSTLLRCLVVVKGATKVHTPRAVFDGLKYDGQARVGSAEYLEPEQVRALVANAKGTAMHAPVVAMAELGLRYGEMAGLRVRDIDFSARVVRVRVQVPQSTSRLDGRFAPGLLKTPHSRRDIPMSDALADVLAVVQGLEPDAPVFATERGEHFVYGAWKRQWRSLVARTPEVPSTLRAHDLRHSAAMHWLRNDVPLGLVSKMLGHANVAITTSLYTHWDARDHALILGASLL